jgi:membrane protein implicated in regulation of membrane protease activity
MLTRVEAQAVTGLTGGGAISAGVVSWLAPITLYLQLASAAISVILGLYALYRIYKKYDK